MEVSGKTIKFSNTLWVQHGGVRVKNEKETVLVEGVDDESYLKVFNHFGRVLRLYTFEDGQWVDSATGSTPTALDESLAGLVPATQHASTAKPAAGKGARAKSTGKTKAAAKTPAAKKPGAGKAAAKGKPSSTGKAAARGKAPSTGKAAAKGKASSTGKAAARGKAPSTGKAAAKGKGR